MKEKLLRDLRLIGIKINFELEIRGYSKIYYGKYDPNKKKIILYPYKNKERTRKYSYGVVLKYLIHEACHHIEHSMPGYVRYKGIMHSAKFYELNEKYWDRAKTLLLFGEVEIEDAEICYDRSFENDYGSFTASAFAL